MSRPRGGAFLWAEDRPAVPRYYVSTAVAVNDAHGVGAFLLASPEIE